MVKDPIATLAHDKADIGLFITVREPTRAMITEATAAGFYTSMNGKKYPRVQLLQSKACSMGTSGQSIPITPRT